MKKDFKNHKETLYSSKGKIVYVVGKPCNIFRFQGKPYDYYFFVLTILETSYPVDLNGAYLWALHFFYAKMSNGDSVYMSVNKEIQLLKSKKFITNSLIYQCIAMVKARKTKK